MNAIKKAEKRREKGRKKGPGKSIGKYNRLAVYRLRKGIFTSARILNKKKKKKKEKEKRGADWGENSQKRGARKRDRNNIYEARGEARRLIFSRQVARLRAYASNDFRGSLTIRH